MAAITSAVIGLGTAAYTIADSEKKKKNAKQQFNSYERQELENAFEDIQISTIGTDIANEEVQRNIATMIDASQQAGFRGVVSSLPKIQSYLNANNRNIQKTIDDQVIQRDYAIAGDERQLRGIRENRDYDNLSAISSEYQAGVQGSRDGMLGVIAAAGSIGRSIEMNSFQNSQNPSIPNGTDINFVGTMPSAQVERIPNTTNQVITNSNFGFPNVTSWWGTPPDYSSTFLTENIFKK